MTTKRYTPGTTVFNYIINYEDFSVNIKECQIKEILPDDRYTLTIVKEGVTIDYQPLGLLGDPYMKFHHANLFTSKSVCIDDAIEYIADYKKDATNNLKKILKKMNKLNNDLEAEQIDINKINDSIIKLITLKQL